MLIIRGLADSFFDGCKIQKAARQANYSPNYKKSANVGVNYSLTITLSMVLNVGVNYSLTITLSMVLNKPPLFEDAAYSLSQF